MSLQKHKVVLVEKKRYQIGRFAPNVGSFILAWMLTAPSEARPMQRSTEEISPEKESKQPSGEQMVRAIAMSAMFRGMDFERHTFVQKHCLSVCSLLEETGPMPLANESGSLPLDLSVLLKLQVEVLAFNFASFFDQGGLNFLVEGESGASKV